MSTLGQRIKERLEAVGMSQAELSRRVGITQPAVNHLIKRGAGGSAHIHKIARELQTTPEYLQGETDDPSLTALHDRQLGYGGLTAEPRDDAIEIAQLDLRYGMGATFLEEHVELETFAFSRAWLRQFTDAPPEKLRWVKGVGNSMEPTILDSEPLLIHLGAELTMSDLIWVFAYGEVGMIKRLRPLPDGSVEVLSDNPTVPSFKAFEGEIHLIARVLGSMKKF